MILSSDESWQMKEGHFLFNNLYLGERVDLHELDSYIKPVCIDQTKRVMQLNTIPPVRKNKLLNLNNIYQQRKDLLLILVK